MFFAQAFTSIGKVLYLDGDLIITYDIAGLYKTYISDYSVAAVLEHGISTVEAVK